MSTKQTSKVSTPLFRAVDYVNDNKYHLLLAASGSVATIKLPNIIGALADHYSFHDQYPKLSIRIILTSSAAAFLAGQSTEQSDLNSLAGMPNVDGIYRDSDEWAQPWVRGASILHIELRRWADLMVIAPLSANTLAKVVGGLCDNLLLATVRAWNTTGTLDTVSERLVNGTEDGNQGATGSWRMKSKKKIIMVAPAMNTAMWRHPITKQHMHVLESDWGVQNGGWIRVLRPIEKELACGDVGDGAMQDWQEIVAAIESELLLKKNVQTPASP